MESWSATAEKRQWPSGLIYSVVRELVSEQQRRTGRGRYKGQDPKIKSVRTSCISRPNSLHILLIARPSSFASRSNLASASMLMGGCFSASVAAFLALRISLSPSRNGCGGTGAPVSL
jgi:hypothetical protein